MSNRYKDALDEARQELGRLQLQHAETEKRIAKLKLTISSLQELLVVEAEGVARGKATAKAISASAFPSVEDMGLTDAIREILKAAQFPCTAGMVRDELEDYGYDVVRYSNALASISVVLKRLVDQGEAKTVDLKDRDKVLTGYVHIPTQTQQGRRHYALHAERGRYTTKGSDVTLTKTTKR